jgi:hypothetical protein
MLNIAEFAPIPSASAKIATSENPGFFKKERAANPKSFPTESKWNTMPP